MLAERLREELSQALMVSVITYSHSYPKQTAELLLDDAKHHWFCGIPNITYPATCSDPLDVLDVVQREMSAWAYLASTVSVLIGHKEDALYLPTMYGLRRNASVRGFKIGYGQAVVVDCETMKGRVIASARE